MNRRRTWTWLVIALVVLLVAGGVLRALSARKAQQEAVAQASVGQGRRPWWSWPRATWSGPKPASWRRACRSPARSRP